MKVSCLPQLAREVLDIALGAIRPGVTTDEIDRLVHEVWLSVTVNGRVLTPSFSQACLERDCYPSPLNYVNFPKSCCT